MSGLLISATYALMIELFCWDAYQTWRVGVRPFNRL